MGGQRGWSWWEGNGLTILSVENVIFEGGLVAPNRKIWQAEW